MAIVDISYTYGHTDFFYMINYKLIWLEVF
jgi:hypothetical protein